MSHVLLIALALTDIQKSDICSRQPMMLTLSLIQKSSRSIKFPRVITRWREPEK